MLVELAVGDAYGACFEYATPTFVERHNTLDGYVPHHRRALPPGNYTDDTQMSIAIAEALIDGDPWTPEALAERFVGTFKRDPRLGYARGFQRFLESIKDGAEFLRLIKPTSTRNGAAMRAMPIGVCSTPAEVVERASIQARLTHDTPHGIASAQASALLTHYFLYDLGPRSKAGHYLERYVPGYAWAMEWSGPVEDDGWMCVQAAVTAIRQHWTLSSILRACVAWTGDVDTVATIALAAASASREVVQDLPESLLNDLENGTYGRDYLTVLDARLKGLMA